MSEKNKGEPAVINKPVVNKPEAQYILNEKLKNCELDKNRLKDYDIEQYILKRKFIQFPVEFLQVDGFDFRAVVIYSIIFDKIVCAKRFQKDQKNKKVTDIEIILDIKELEKISGISYKTVWKKMHWLVDNGYIEYNFKKAKDQNICKIKKDISSVVKIPYFNYIDCIAGTNIYDKIVYGYFLNLEKQFNFHGKNKDLKVSIRKMSEELNLHRDTIKESIEMLSKFGLISYSEDNGDFKININLLDECIIEEEEEF